MSPQATQGCEAKRDRRVWPLQGQWYKSDITRTATKRGKVDQKGGRVRAGGGAHNEYTEQHSAKQGAPPQSEWVVDRRGEWGGLPPQISMVEQQRRGGRQHRHPPCTTTREAGPFRGTHRSPESVARWQFDCLPQRKSKTAPDRNFVGN